MKSRWQGFYLGQFRVLACILLAILPMTTLADVAGQFQFVSGEVIVIRANGTQFLAKKGDQLNEGDTVVTGSASSAQILMADGGHMALRRDTRMRVDQFHYAGVEDGSERSVLSLLKGGLRAVTGAIGRINKPNYRIATPSATIGIRGTDFEPMVVLPPPQGDAALGAPGTYVRVNSGAVTMENRAGSIVVGPYQVGYAADSGTLPVLLEVLPDFYHTSSAPMPSGVPLSGESPDVWPYVRQPLRELAQPFPATSEGSSGVAVGSPPSALSTERPAASAPPSSLGPALPLPLPPTIPSGPALPSPSPIGAPIPPVSPVEPPATSAGPGGPFIPPLPMPSPEPLPRPAPRLQAPPGTPWPGPTPSPTPEPVRNAP